jgi:glycosyltransferase involved in cell wall biosynthesis
MAQGSSSPLVSVVLTTHNRPRWLGEALRSVLRGTFTDIEVIVSNNGDPEDTRRLERVVRDPRVRWIEQDQSLTMLENWLTGLSLARGRYAAILHDDDRWSPEFLSTLIPPLEQRRDAVVSFADHYIIDQGGDVDPTATEATTRRWRADLAEGFHRPFFSLVARQSIPATGSVFRRAALPVGEFTPEVGSIGDLWTAYQLAKSHGAAYYSPRRLMYYRVHAAADSAAGQLDRYLAIVGIRQKLLADPDLLPYRATLAAALAKDHRLAGIELLRLARREEARSNLVSSLRLRPSAKALAGWTASWWAPKRMLARL